MSSVLLVLYFAAMCTVKLCYRVDWPIVFFMGAAAFSANHIGSMLDSIIALNFPTRLNQMATGQFNQWVILNEVLCRVLVYGLIDLLIIRRNRDIDDDSVSFAPSLLILLISIMVNLYLNLIFSRLVDDKTYWISFCNYSVHPE